MSRYSDINYIMDMDIYDGYMMIVVAIKQKQKDEAFLMYLHQLPYMESGTTFEQYYSPRPLIHNNNDNTNVASGLSERKVTKEDVYSSVEKVMANLAIQGGVS